MSQKRSRLQDLDLGQYDEDEQEPPSKRRRIVHSDDEDDVVSLRSGSRASEDEHIYHRSERIASDVEDDGLEDEHDNEGENEEYERKLELIINGSPDDNAEFNAQFEGFTQENWGEVSKLLFQNRVKLQEASTENVIDVFRLCYQLFCYPFKTGHDVIDRVKAIYPNVGDMKSQFQKIRQFFGALHIEMMKRDLLEEDTVGKKFKQMLSRIAFGMKFTYENMINIRLVQHASDQSMRACIQNMSPLSLLYKEVDRNDMKPRQQLIHFYWDKAFKQGLRKFKKSLFRPRYTEDGTYVHAYEYMCDISQFVYESLYPIEQNHYWFECLTESSAVPKHVIDTLENVKCEWLPDLQRNRHVWAFRNGLFHTLSNSFYPFHPTDDEKGVEGIQDDDIVAIKFIDLNFDYIAMEEEMKGPASYLGIDCPPLKQILGTQKFDTKEVQIILCLLGRMLFGLHELDKWGVFPWFLGLGGTGKSTLLRWLIRLFESTDVGIMGNTGQKEFSLSKFENTLLYLFLDVDRNFNLDQATWQSMVVAEEVTYSRKYKDEITRLWDQPGAAASKSTLYLYRRSNHLQFLDQQVEFLRYH